MISYFWFPARGRILTNLYQLKIYNFWDALIVGRTDGSLIRVMTNIYPNENIDQADQRLKNFIKIINPLLEKFLPN
jgi:EpsI family protein